MHLVNPVSPLIGDGSEGKVGGVAIQNVVGLGCKWAEVGSRSLVDETLGASHQPYKSKKKKMGRANGLRDRSPSDLCCTRRGLYLPEAATPCPASALLLPCLLPAAITCHGTCWAYLEPVVVAVVARRVVGQEEGGGSRRVRSATSLSRLSSHHVPRSDWPRAWELDSLDRAPQTQILSPNI